MIWNKWWPNDSCPSDECNGETTVIEEKIDNDKIAKIWKNNENKI